MGAKKSKILIPLKESDLQKLTQDTHFNEKEIRAMYKRYWSYCLPDATLNKQQFYSMFTCTDGCKGKRIVDHIFRTTDKDDNHSLGEFRGSKLSIYFKKVIFWHAPSGGRKGGFQSSSWKINLWE